MKAFSFNVNGKEDFSKGMSLVQPEWMKLRGPKPDISRDMILMEKACKNVSTPDCKITLKKLA
jgi:hypothetical protein